MAAQNIYKMTSIKHNSTVLKGIEDFSLDGGLTVEMLDGGGNVDSYNFIAAGSKQRINFSTKDIAVYLALCGINGLEISGSAKLYANFSKLANGGAAAGGSSDEVCTINQGVMYMKSISAPLNKAAVLSAGVIATYDGTNLPIVWATGTADVSARETDGFFGGKVDFNGTAVDCQGWSFELNPNYAPAGKNGLIYETEVHLMKRAPRFVVPILDLSVIRSLGPLQGLSGTEIHLYLRKQTVNGGGAVADASTVHVKFTAKVGGAHIENINAPNGQFAQSNLVIIPVSNATDPIIAISTSSAIS